MKKIVGALAVFVITYALFSAAGYLFPVDQEWYNSLKKTGLDAKRNCDRHHLGHPVCPDLPFSSHCICCVFI